jgi:hypothetical protein
MQELKLTIELVPSTSWYNNVRSAVPRSTWNKLRKKTYADYGCKCGVCGAEGRLNCHEIWEYDDERYVQRLSGFIALCDMCHHVKHLGRAGILAAEGKLDYEKVVEHYMRVNGCDRQAFEEHRATAFRQWRERSRVEWAVDLSLLQRLPV